MMTKVTIAHVLHGIVPSESGMMGPGVTYLRHAQRANPLGLSNPVLITAYMKSVAA